MLPPISIVTITKNRRKFFPHLIDTIYKQDYPKSLVDWVVLEDGNESVAELVKQVPFGRYYFSEDLQTVGKKRNIANGLANGEYILYFDDDNYAFPSRILESVMALQATGNYEIAGSSEMYILDDSIKKIYPVGPFLANHATASTWCFKKSLLSHTRFDDFSRRAEEAKFLEDWTVPLLQIPKNKTSVSFDHGKNTQSKKHLLADATFFFEIEEIIKDTDSAAFYRTFGGDVIK